MVYFFGIPPKSKFISLSDCTWVVTLLPSSSVFLKKSLTTLRRNLCWNTIWRVSEREVWQRIEYLFRNQTKSKSLHSQTVLGQWHSSLDPQFFWIGPRPGWKAFKIKKHFIECFWARNLTTYQVILSYAIRSKTLVLSDCTRTVTHLTRPSFSLNNSLTSLKSNLWRNTV